MLTAFIIKLLVHKNRINACAFIRKLAEWGRGWAIIKVIVLLDQSVNVAVLIQDK